MNKVRIKVIGKFDKVGEQTLADEAVSVPGVVPIRWTVKVWFLKVTIVGRVEVSQE